ncbi:porin [Paraburkholderia silviterrae]|uniref:Porin n=1 Tax=Paraburkholderia silviterrae TaxID=2528715 RepID=A0A4R5M464_9BURK|nr:porin [Paraburkholderia silviterrae]TDG20076.1 porin [Paraburkholderia silviterrae]
MTMGAASSAHAQSSVTLYGVLDTGLLYTSRTGSGSTGKDGAHQFALTDGGTEGSRFGFTGTEDLGAGLKAEFVLESGISTVNGGLNNSNGSFFGRQSYVGLSGDFGEVKAGTQYSPFVLAIIMTDPRTGSYFGSGAAIYIGRLFSTGLFNPNAITYTSPTIAGLQAGAMIALGGQAGDFQAGRQYAARLTYTHGGLRIESALYSGNAGPSPTPLPTTVPFTGRMLGAAYAWGAVTLKAAYINYKVAGSFNERVYTAGGAWQFTPAFSTDAGVWVVRDANNSTNHGLLAALGLKYALSKRTYVYGDLAMVNNHGLMDVGLSANGALYGPTGTTMGAIIGIRHGF